MFSVVAAIVYFWFVIWAFRRHPWAIVSFLFLLSSFTLRIFSAVYVDLAGPLNAIDLGFDVGGGTATPFFVASVILVIASVIYFQSQIRIGNRPLTETFLGLRRDVFADIAFVCALAVLIGGYMEMLHSGVIPLFMGIDRIVYAEQFGGVFYQKMYEMSFLYSSMLGFFFTRSRIREGRFDRRFLLIELALLIFFALTGNRFSAFMVSGTFFAMSLGALFLLGAKGSGARVENLESFRSQLNAVISRRRIAVVATIGFTIVTALSLHNFYNVRYADTGGAGDIVLQRTLVQPIELYTVTWERLVNGEISDQGLAWDLMFGNPIDPTRNTGIQFLMANALGEAKTTEMLDQNTQHAGGYPEVFIELFGIWFALVAMVASAAVVGFLFKQILRAVILGRFLTFFFSVYVYFGFAVIYIGGMLNFLLVWTYWAKLAMLLAVTIFEPFFMRSPRTGGGRLPIGQT